MPTPPSTASSYAPHRVLRLLRGLTCLALLSWLGAEPTFAADGHRKRARAAAAAEAAEAAAPKPAPPRPENAPTFKYQENKKLEELNRAEKDWAQAQQEVGILRQKPLRGKANARARQELNAAVNRELALSQRVARLKLELAELRKRNAAPATR